MQLRSTPGIKYQENQMQLMVHLVIRSWKDTNSLVGYFLLNFDHETFWNASWNPLAAASGVNMLLNKKISNQTVYLTQYQLNLVL